MLKKTYIIFAMFVFLFLPYRVVFADSLFSYPNNCNGDFSNCSNSYAQDTNYSTYNRNSTDGTLNLSGFSLGSVGSPVTGVTVRLRGHYIGGASIHNVLLAVPAFGGLSAGCVANYTITLSGSDTTYTNTIPSSCFYSHTLVPSDFTSGLVLAVGTSTNGSLTYYIDSVELQANYTSPTSSMNIDSSSASPSGQFVNLNLSGTTATVSSTMQCTVGLLERCKKSGYAGFLSPSTIANVLLDGSATNTTTIDLGGGYYKAHGWGGTDNSWVAENVHVPYNSGWTCDYPYSIICSDNHELSYMDDYSHNSQFVATPSAGITNTEIVEPEPTNPLAWVVWKIRQTLIDLFIPHDNVIMQETDYVKELIQTKAPIAYGNAVLALDWSTGAISTATPSIHIALAHNENSMIPDINWTPPDFFISTMNTIRGALDVVLWMSFVLYLVVRIRSAFV